MAVIHAPRGSGKAYMASTPSGIESYYSRDKYPKSTTHFPKKFGFNTLYRLVKVDIELSEFDHTVDEIGLAAMRMTVEASHLGVVYLDYILLHLSNYIYLLNRNSSQMHSGHLLHDLSLTQLIVINMYRQYYDKDYSLPKSLSRKYLNIKEELFKSLNAYEVQSISDLNMPVR